MASDSELPESEAAFADLEKLVHHLGDELASFRRRALQAEARVKALESSPGATDKPGADRKTERGEAELRCGRDGSADATDKRRVVRVRDQQHETASEMTSRKERGEVTILGEYTLRTEK